MAEDIVCIQLQIHVGHAQSPIAGLKNYNRFIKKTISYKGKVILSVHIEVHVQLFIMFYKLRAVKVKFSKRGTI